MLGVDVDGGGMARRERGEGWGCGEADRQCLCGACPWRGCVRGLREVAAGGGSASGHARGSRGAREPLGSILSPPPAPLGAQNRRAKTDAAAKGEAIES